MLKENSLLILKDVQNCSYYRPINTTFEFFQDFFSFKKLKLQVIDRLGKTNKKKFFSRYLIECDPFYASNVFGQIIKILRVLILREDSDEIEKRLTLKMENRIRREKQQKGDR